MNSLRQILLRGIVLGVLAAVVAAGALMTYVAWYTRQDRIFPGVVVGRTPVGGLRPDTALGRLSGQSDRTGASGFSAASMGSPAPPPERVTTLRWHDRSWPLALRDVQREPDVNAALQSASSLGRTGPALGRTQVFLGGLVHGYHIPLDPRINEDIIRVRLMEIAREVERKPQDARIDFETGVVSPEVVGRQLDVAANLRLVASAVRAGVSEVELTVTPLQPSVTTAQLTQARQHLLARFTTPILAADSGRVHNIAMAVRKISGLVVKPGDVFSFNDIVGPRDGKNGWAQAKELYQGEFVLGYGGGICQVSSTLYNSVLLGGLEVRQRFHHDRPLQYIAPGRDATVAWNTLDFKFRNNRSAPILVGARVLPGSPQQIEVSIHSTDPPADGGIEIEEADVRYFPPPLEESLDPTLPSGERKVIDEGHYGIEVKIFRVFRAGRQPKRELVSHDRYLPKAGKVRVGVGNEPGSQKLLNPGLH